ncbi:MAG TPA: hypothetical protein VGN96_11035 [Roseococcus sp.]|jgi:hypothetical protein|nr:hypothetical protein [Roseococcus sp.]
MTRMAHDAIAALQARDPTAYREARRAYHAADLAYSEAGKAVAAEGKAHYRKLERLLAEALAPHDVEWNRYGLPSETPNGSSDVNHADWVAMAHLAGEVSPKPQGGRYNMKARVTIPFSMTPRDGDEFWRAVWMLKAMADAATEGGL